MVQLPEIPVNSSKIESGKPNPESDPGLFIASPRLVKGVKPPVQLPSWFFPPSLAPLRHGGVVPVMATAGVTAGVTASATCSAIST